MSKSKIRPIRTEADYETALARIDALMDAEAGTPEGEELDVLTDLVDKHNHTWDAIRYGLEPMIKRTGFGLLDFYSKAASESAPQRETYQQPTIVEGVH